VRLLLTGAPGFTGRHFTKIATISGYEVIALKADLTDAKAVNDEVLSIQPEVVVNLAGIAFVAYGDADVMYNVNVLGTRHLLQALFTLENKPKAILLVSSANIYGNAQAEVLDEMTLQVPVNDYGVSKLAMEHVARLWMDKLPIIITRPFNYTGLGQSNNFLIPKIIDHFVRKTSSIELGNLNINREFSDVRTVCHVYIKLLRAESAIGNTLNVCSGKSYSLREIISIMDDIAGYKINVRVNPEFVRPNEVKRLVGSNKFLHEVIGKQEYPHIKETLKWMYEGDFVND